jgi:hypothetical protein
MTLQPTFERINRGTIPYHSRKCIPQKHSTHGERMEEEIGVAIYKQKRL